MFEPEGINKDIYLLEWEFRKQQYKEDKPILDELQKEGLVKVVKKTNKRVLFQYLPKKAKPKHDN